MKIKVTAAVRRKDEAAFNPGTPGLAEVSSDRVGLILGLEMSRLARSCKDWHALLELCAIYFDHTAARAGANCNGGGRIA